MLGVGLREPLTDGPAAPASALANAARMAFAATTCFVVIVETEGLELTANAMMVLSPGVAPVAVGA